MKSNHLSSNRVCKVTVCEPRLHAKRQRCGTAGCSGPGSSGHGGSQLPRFGRMRQRIVLTAFGPKHVVNPRIHAKVVLPEKASATSDGYERRLAHHLCQLQWPLPRPKDFAYLKGPRQGDASAPPQALQSRGAKRDPLNGRRRDLKMAAPGPRDKGDPLNGQGFKPARKAGFWPRWPRHVAGSKWARLCGRLRGPLYHGGPALVIWVTAQAV